MLPNGIVVAYALIQKRENVETLLFSGLGFSLSVTDLQPFTVYEFRVQANTSAGSGLSQWTRIKTPEDGKRDTF